MAAVAELLAHGVDVVITHGNGPQVGNLLVKNELAAAVVPPVPLDWCGAQTQATLGFVLMDALDAALAARGVDRRTRRGGDPHPGRPDDPGFAKPTKPIGRFLPADEARAARRARRDLGGPRREGLAPGGRLARAARDHRRAGGAALVEAGFVVVANGGGGIPVVRREDGVAARRRGRHRQGPRRGAARRARRGRRAGRSRPTYPRRCCATARPRPSRSAGSRCRGCRRTPREGHFASGSMGPKVDAVCRFVQGTDLPGVITEPGPDRRRGDRRRHDRHRRRTRTDGST